MPKRQKYESESDSLDFESESDEDFSAGVSDEDYEAKPKSTRKKATPAKAKNAESFDSEDEDFSPSKPKKSKNPVLTVPTDVANEWTLHPPSLIYKTNLAAQGGTKIAAIDLDGTLIFHKTANPFAPAASEDWKWWNPSVIPKLKALVQDDYKILIISNQGGVRSALTGTLSEKLRGMVSGIFAELTREGIPAQVIMATQKDEFRKPETGMWDFFVANMNAGITPNLDDCFYVGDMAGRTGAIEDKSDTDKVFAENVGIEFHTPDDYFGRRAAGPAQEVDVINPANAGLAAAFMELAALLEGAKLTFKAKAFATVGHVIAEATFAITSSKDLKGVKGVGKSSEAKIDEYLRTGKLGDVEDLKAEPSAPKLSKADALAAKFL